MPRCCERERGTRGGSEVETVGVEAWHLETWRIWEVEDGVWEVGKVVRFCAMWRTGGLVEGM
jgi:hypothetical protein